MDRSMLEIIEENSRGVEKDRIRLFVYQLQKATMYLHESEIIHRDIKPENLLVNNDNTLKQCDFGFARTFPGDGAQLTAYVATRWYRSPELLITNEYSYPVDIWAIGCIFAEMIDGNPLYPGDNQIDQQHVIQKVMGKQPENQTKLKNKNGDLAHVQFRIPSNLDSQDKKYRGKVDANGMNLLHRLLDLDPNERITATEAMDHPFFTSLKPSKGSRANSPIIEKHRAVSSTYRGTNDKQIFVGNNHHKYSAKENYNPYTQYGKFAGRDYGQVIRSTSKGKKKLEEAKYHSRQPNSFQTNSTNHLASTVHQFNFDSKKKSFGNYKKFKNKHSGTGVGVSSNTPIPHSGTVKHKDFAINTTQTFHRGSRRTTEENIEEGGALRNSSIKREDSKNRNKQNNMKMFQISNFQFRKNQMKNPSTKPSNTSNQ